MHYYLAKIKIKKCYNLLKNLEVIEVGIKVVLN